MSADRPSLRSMPKACGEVFSCGCTRLHQVVKTRSMPAMTRTKNARAGRVLRGCAKNGLFSENQLMKSTPWASLVTVQISTRFQMNTTGPRNPKEMRVISSWAIPLPV